MGQPGGLYLMVMKIAEMMHAGVTCIIINVPRERAVSHHTVTGFKQACLERTLIECAVHLHFFLYNFINV